MKDLGYMMHSIKECNYVKEYIGFINSDDIYEKYYRDFDKIHQSKFQFRFFEVRKHWGTLHGYKPWKILVGGLFKPLTGFFIKSFSKKSGAII